MNKMSRVDILLYAMDQGFDYEDATDIAHLLSPECRSVPTSRVVQRVAAILSDLSGKV